MKDRSVIETGVKQEERVPPHQWQDVRKLATRIWHHFRHHLDIEENFRLLYLDDLKALSVQGERGFRNRVDKVVHVDQRFNANIKTKKKVL